MYRDTARNGPMSNDAYHFRFMTRGAEMVSMVNSREYGQFARLPHFQQGAPHQIDSTIVKRSAFRPKQTRTRMEER